MFDFLGYFRNRSRQATPPARPASTYRNAVVIPAGGDGEAAPEWIRIVPIGAFPNHHDGAHEITAAHVQEMVANFTAHSVDLLFDVDHESLYGNSRAAGWSDAVEAREDGLYCRFPVFTPTGQAHVDNRDYRYFSPVYVLNALDKQGKEIGARVLSVALTNTPYMDAGEIHAVGNSRGGPAPTIPNTPMTPELRACLLYTSDAADERG